MPNNDLPDYKALFHKAEEERKQEAELRRQAEDRERQERARNQPTTFREFIKACHDLLSRPLEAGTLSCSTRGKIPVPKGKYCPTRLSELCKILSAQEKFQLGNDVIFDNHSNALEEPDENNPEVLDETSTMHPRSDQFCIYQVDDTTNTLLTTVKYKPPHKCYEPAA
ncbi:conserved hypothetical protein [Histoplasma capsulatum var. duboisii H88]|uniref:Uncharacterized protein n=1 Tax=Ajellomyces capsulatus (strain H88) TaxID=544711 RepID=F0UGS3_AJEC8|nr:conserved hypothetical protein [Histoplasma capsulatum var. duboisii H88]